jgi:hypothetical protein
MTNKICDDNLMSQQTLSPAGSLSLPFVYTSQFDLAWLRRIEGVDCEDIGLHEAGAAEGRSVEVE